LWLAEALLPVRRVLFALDRDQRRNLGVLAGQDILLAVILDIQVFPA
jgi:hypothetical protein